MPKEIKKQGDTPQQPPQTGEDLAVFEEIAQGMAELIERSKPTETPLQETPSSPPGETPIIDTEK